MPELSSTRPDAFNDRKPFLPNTREVFVPKTGKMDSGELQRQINAHLQSVEGTEKKLAAPVRAAVRELRNPRATREGFRRHLMALVVALSQTSFFPQDLRGEIDPVSEVSPSKLRVELRPGGEVVTVPDVDQEKETMTRSDPTGERARNTQRRRTLWEAYLKATNLDQVVQTSSNERGEIQGVRLNPGELQTNISEKLNEMFGSFVASHLHREVELLLAQKDLPTSSEEAAIAVDRAITRAVRAAYFDAQQKGLKSGINLHAADSLGMQRFAYSVQEVLNAHPERGSLNAFPILEALRQRSWEKSLFEEHVPNSPRGLSETLDVTPAILNVEFNLLLNRGREDQLDFLRSCRPGDMVVLLSSHFEWFDAHLSDIRADSAIKDVLLQTISSELERGRDENRARYRDLQRKLLR